MRPPRVSRALASPMHRFSGLNMAVGGVVQAAEVALGVHIFFEFVAVQQRVGMRVADAFLKFLPLGKLLHVSRLERYVAVTPLEVALDVVGFDALADDVPGFDAHLVDAAHARLADGL
jgi:hypothetical protein